MSRNKTPASNNKVAMLHISFEKSRSDYTLLTVDAIYGQKQEPHYSQSPAGDDT